MQCPAGVQSAQFAVGRGRDDFASHDDANVASDCDPFDIPRETVAGDLTSREHGYDFRLASYNISWSIQHVIWVHEFLLGRRILLNDNAHLLGIGGPEAILVRLAI